MDAAYYRHLLFGLLVAVAGLASGQDASITVCNETRLDETSTVAGGSVFTPLTIELETRQVARVLIFNEAWTGVSVNAVNLTDRTTAVAEEIERDRFYAVHGSGELLVQVFATDSKSGAFRFVNAFVTIGKPRPPPEPDDPDDPEPDDPPDVPPDFFDNIGQRVAVWAKDAPKKKEVGQVYVEIANQLSAGQIVSINQAAESLTQKTYAIVGDDGRAAWLKAFQGIQEDLNGRWPIPRQTYADWLKAIAAGLGAK